MDPRIHVSIWYSFKKKIITCHASSHHVINHTPQNHWKSFPKKNKEIWKKKKSTMTFFCVSLTNIKHSRGVCRHFKRKIQVLLLYIKTLCEEMVIDSLMFISWPSVRKWSLISLCSHQDPLWSNGHWFP